MRWVVLTFSLASLLAVRVPDARACSCLDSGPPCQGYFQSDLVFSGTVTSITPVPGADFETALRVEFDDVHSPEGVKSTPITVFTPDNPAACGFTFKPGERYVVYARRNGPAQFVVTICSRTRAYSQADADLSFFATLATPASGGRVFGTVTRFSRDPATTDWKDYGPVPQVVVTMTSDGQKFQAQTDLNGHYQFLGVAPGRYELTASPPPPFSADDLTRRFELRDRRGCFSANFSVRPDGRINGTLVDADGRPVAGAQVDLLPADRIGHFLFRELETSTTDTSGRFEMARVSPGRYILGYNVVQPANPDIVFPTVFHPAASDPRNAAVLELGEGEHVQDLRIVVPSTPRSYRVTGRVVFESGQAAAGVSVSLTDGHGRLRQVSEDARTGPDGTFSFVVHDGQTYRASARDSEPGTGRTLAAGSVSFVASEKDAQDLKVVLSPVRR